MKKEDLELFKQVGATNVEVKQISYEEIIITIPTNIKSDKIDKIYEIENSLYDKYPKKSFSFRLKRES